MKLTRRQAMAAGAAAVATASLAQQPRPSSPNALGALAQRSSRRFGSAVASSPPGADAGSFTNPAYARLLEHDCELLVPENQLKWQWVRRSPAEFDFRAFDAIADFAGTHGSSCAAIPSSGRRPNGIRNGSPRLISARPPRPNGCWRGTSRRFVGAMPSGSTPTMS